ncbi:MAG: hypothetical protein JJLCMIEE_01491 [Acidimicrobiales bacterium]|nr:hypothetical protein [Acidimicrobiales bacterium]
MSPAAARDDGQASVELALVLPLVLLMLLVVAQVGLIVRDRVLVIHATREAARVAVVDPRQDAAEEAARSKGGLDPDRLLVEVRGGTASGDRLEIVVRYQAATDLPLIGPVVPDVDLHERVVVRVE